MKTVISGIQRALRYAVQLHGYRRARLVTGHRHRDRGARWWSATSRLLESSATVKPLLLCGHRREDMEPGMAVRNCFTEARQLDAKAGGGEALTWDLTPDVKEGEEKVPVRPNALEVEVILPILLVFLAGTISLAAALAAFIISRAFGTSAFRALCFAAATFTAAATLALLALTFVESTEQDHYPHGYKAVVSAPAVIRNDNSESAARSIGPQTTYR